MQSERRSCSRFALLHNSRSRFTLSKFLRKYPHLLFKKGDHVNQSSQCSLKRTWNIGGYSHLISNYYTRTSHTLSQNFWREKNTSSTWDSSLGLWLFDLLDPSQEPLNDKCPQARSLQCGRNPNPRGPRYPHLPEKAITSHEYFGLSSTLIHSWMTPVRSLRSFFDVPFSGFPTSLGGLCLIYPPFFSFSHWLFLGV